MDLKWQAEVRDILSANGIKYVIKTVNLQSAPAIGSRRGQIGNFGINQDYSYEYKIYVHKDDYDKSMNLTR